MPTIFEASSSKSPKKNKPNGGVSPLTAFAVRPDGVRFETQEEAEEVVLFLRQHIVVNVPWLIIAAVLLAAPTVIFPLALGIVRFPFAIPAGYFVIGTLFWYLSTFGFILANFISWFFNIYIVTNERIVDIDFLYLLYKQFSQAELSKIQDINYSSGGVIATIFNYGNVTVETAGEMPNLEFARVPQPDKVVQTIRSLIDGNGTI